MAGINLKFSNRSLYTFIAAVIVISLGVIVYAVNTNIGYHPIEQIDKPVTGCTNGQFLQWNATSSSWICASGGVGVSKIIPGANINISPASGTGNVIINAQTGASSPSGEVLEKGTVALYLNNGTCVASYSYFCSATLTGGGAIVATPTSQLSGTCYTYNSNYPVSCTTTNTFIGYSMMPVTYTTKSFYVGYDSDGSDDPSCWSAPTGAQMDQTTCSLTTGNWGVCAKPWTSYITSNFNPNGVPTGVYVPVSVEDATGGCKGSLGGSAVDTTSVNVKITYKEYS